MAFIHELGIKQQMSRVGGTSCLFLLALTEIRGPENFVYYDGGNEKDLLVHSKGTNLFPVSYEK